MKESIPSQYIKEAYSNNLEYIVDELNRLNLLIHIFLSKQKNVAYQYDPLLSEKNIDSLLSGLFASWTRENDDASHLEISQLRQSLQELELQIQTRKAVSMKTGSYLALPYLSELFKLSEFEELILFICFAPELDARYGEIYAFIQNNISQTQPSGNLILDLLCFSAEDKLADRSVFDERAALMKYKLLYKVDDKSSRVTLNSAMLRVDKRISDFLLGSEDLDIRLFPCADMYTPAEGKHYPVYSDKFEDQTISFINSCLNDKSFLPKGITLYFYGDDDSEKKFITKSICNQLDIPLIIGDINKMLDQSTSFEDIIWLFAREAILQQSAVCIENFDSLLSDNPKYKFYVATLLEALSTFSRLIFITGSGQWKPESIFSKHLFITQKFNVADYMARKQIWEYYVKDKFNIASNIDMDLLSAKFYLTAEQIENALTTAHHRAIWEGAEDNLITQDFLYNACREQISHKLTDLAQKIIPKYKWDDIVLQPTQKSVLREICNQAKYKHIVYENWGFNNKLSLGKGLNIIFSGPSGTGKTMAAEVIANELNQELYKVDLSQIVSKYIGETEKNISRIFREVENLDAILFFDEADSILGKRSEVKDAHDRHANIEVGYLLQKFEEHEGIIILASNLSKNIDDAFQRRMHFIVDFSAPDEKTRYLIWENIFPKEAPLSGNIDLDFLANKFKFTGGNIKNAALHAAFLAATDSKPIGMEHIIQAVRKEYQKMGSLLPHDIDKFIMEKGS